MKRIYTFLFVTMAMLMLSVSSAWAAYVKLTAPDGTESTPISYDDIVQAFFDKININNKSNNIQFKIFENIKEKEIKFNFFFEKTNINSDIILQNTKIEHEDIYSILFRQILILLSKVKNLEIEVKSLIEKKNVIDLDTMKSKLVFNMKDLTKRINNMEYEIQEIKNFNQNLIHYKLEEVSKIETGNILAKVDILPNSKQIISIGDNIYLWKNNEQKQNLNKTPINNRDFFNCISIKDENHFVTSKDSSIQIWEYDINESKNNDEKLFKCKEIDFNRVNTIFDDFKLDSEDKKFVHRVIIATIARAIVNNDTNDSRKEYINKAGDYLLSKLRRLDLSENIITDLANSFGNDGFFFFNNNFVYYSFTSGDTQYAIPIAVHKQESSNGRIFTNITFNKRIGAIPLTSFGEVMNPTGKVINEIDGVVMDKADPEKPQIGVITLNETIRAKIREHFEKGDIKSKQWQKIARAMSFLRGNSGKSFIAFNGLDSKFKVGEEVFKIKQNENGQYESAISEEYAESIAQSLGLVGIQQLTTIEE